jgi:hypothetical protein
MFADDVRVCSRPTRVVLLQLKFLIILGSLRANYSQPEIYDKIAATDTKCKCSVISFGLH